MVTVTITHAAPFHLLADAVPGEPLKLRRTRAGDAFERAEAEACATTLAGEPGKVSLGLPSVRAAEPLVAPGVGTMPIYDPTDSQR